MSSGAVLKNKCKVYIVACKMLKFFTQFLLCMLLDMTESMFLKLFKVLP